MRKAFVASPILAALLFTAPASRAQGPVEAKSFQGTPLHRLALPETRRLDFEQKLAQARADYEADPDSAVKAVWVGRRLAYLGRYREAIKVYSKALAKHPDEPRLYRHRGHRFISTRQLDEAIADFERAAALIEGQPDRIEPDGLPNAQNKPRSTLHTNIWYHLGLARYLKRDWAGTATAYRACLEASTNDDMLTATLHWLYMTYRRMGEDAKAEALLTRISPNMDIIENADYHRLLLLYKGLLEPEDLQPSGDDPTLSSATLGYGIANWHHYNGREKQARKLFQSIVAGSNWAAFGYIAAEAEL